MPLQTSIQKTLQAGIAIPAHPLALTVMRKLDEKRQRALSRYYIAAGAGGIAVGVHTTQFQIRAKGIGLFRPVLELAAEEMTMADRKRDTPLVRIGGVCGSTREAVDESRVLRDLGYHAGLLSLGALRLENDDVLIEHCKEVARIIPIIGFYLQPTVGGRVLSHKFWCQLCEVEALVAIKIAPFNRYQTLDVVRAVGCSGRDDIALYTGNDDNIIFDLITPHRVPVGTQVRERRIVGGLLGHWSVWTKRAVEQLQACHAAIHNGPVSSELLSLAAAITDCNAAFFDAANSFRGCIAGLHEVLRRQGLLEGTWCLDPGETLSPEQSAEIDRVYASYPGLSDDCFVEAHLDEWLR
jgi:dihydrodipicolinate synthase/N-acetylneuraminate lyase